ncbi:iron complex transport system substrate-binding protein [Klenkia marina]|uniref:Iron complex transport system substrate-binding protein n=1 Tax=Klenkia marina TaxID=1960309 RepID=A0A1G4X8K2_9ACTN|nr:ABC transporter substrate-binding protein [Klenkia marina]SCX37543.1 iron complex transport system substrate-binding protein [Klenkia marina]
MPLITHRLRTTAAALACAGLLTACGASEAVPESAAATGGEQATEYPLVLDNCGTEVTVDAPPQRVVSLDQGSTELMLSLGLGDRIVGTASWTDPVLPSLADANADVPRLADNAPGYEAVLGTDPDFVTASFGRHFATGGVAERARFTETGIGTYLSPTDCSGGQSVNAGGKRSEPLQVDALYQEIRELAAVFDVPERGEQLVAELQQRAAAATAEIEASGVTLGFWFADTRSPYFAGGVGAPQLLAEGVGGANVFADLADDWSAVSWEAVVDREPDVLVLGDLARDRFPGDRLADKEAFLAADPLTSTMQAVQDQQYVALSGAELNPSIRFVDGLEDLAAGLAELGRTS